MSGDTCTKFFGASPQKEEIIASETGAEAGNIEAIDNFRFKYFYTSIPKQ